MPDDDAPKTSRTVHLPTSPSEKRREINDRIRMQADQSDEERSRGVDARHRKTQDWTPFYRDRLAAASRQALAAGGRAADELAINEMLVLPTPQTPREPDYVPPPEVLEEIAREEALAERERELDARERELAEREDRIHESSLTPVPPKTYDYDIPDHQVHREFGYRQDVTAPPPTWVGGKRMTAQQRAKAEAEGMELFGIDPREGSAWSRLDNLDSPESLQPRHDRMIGRPSEAQRIADLANARQSNDDPEPVTKPSDPDAYAQQLADGVVAQEQGTNADDEYAKRQQAAQDYIDDFMHRQREGF